MGLNVGNVPVKQVYVGSTPVTAVYVGSELVWPTIIKLTGTSGMTSRNQLRDAVAALGLDYRTVTHLPFEIDTSQATSLLDLFNGWTALVVAPEMTTAQVTDMGGLFRGCTALEYVGDLQTSNVTNAGFMFDSCPALTDGNVRLLGKHPNVSTTAMIANSGLTREPFYTTDGQPWPTAEVVQITLGAGSQARDQLRAALTDRGLDYTTITEIPFDIELVGSGSAQLMFYGCSALTSVPPLDTSQVTNMNGMFQECRSLVTIPPLDTSNVTNAPSMFAYCRSLTSVPAMDTSQMTNMRNMFNGCSSLTSVSDMDTAQVTDMGYMFSGCAALTDGNVRLIGRHPDVDTTGMILNSGLTREPWDTEGGKPVDVHEVTLTNVTGGGTVHPLVSVTVPAGETWSVRIQGTVTKATAGSAYSPHFRIGVADSGTYGQGAAVDFSGTVTAANSTIALVSKDFVGTSFTGTVTIEK